MTRLVDTIASIASWSVPFVAFFGGCLFASGSKVSGVVVVACAALLHDGLMRTRATLLEFHAEEYRRLTGKEP